MSFPCLPSVMLKRVDCTLCCFSFLSFFTLVFLLSYFSTLLVDLLVGQVLRATTTAAATSLLPPGPRVTSISQCTNSICLVLVSLLLCLNILCSFFFLVSCSILFYIFLCVLFCSISLSASPYVLFTVSLCYV